MLLKSTTTGNDGHHFCVFCVLGTLCAISQTMEVKLEEISQLPSLWVLLGPGREP